MILIKFDCVNYCIGSKRAETTRNLDAISWLVSFDLISNPYIQLTLVNGIYSVLDFKNIFTWMFPLSNVCP